MDILVTKRLTIRPPLEVDCDDLALHLADEKLRAGLPDASNVLGRDNVVRWVGQRCLAARAGEGLAFTIHRERLIGAITLDRLKGETWLGFFLAPAWSGRGFMAEALDAVLAHVFARSDIRAVRTADFADNPAALRLLAKLGFGVDGSRLDRAAFRRAATHLAEAA